MKSLVDDALEQVGGGLGEGELVEARIDGGEVAVQDLVESVVLHDGSFRERPCICLAFSFLWPLVRYVLGISCALALCLARGCRLTGAPVLLSGIVSFLFCCDYSLCLFALTSMPKSLNSLYFYRVILNKLQEMVGGWRFLRELAGVTFVIRLVVRCVIRGACVIWCAIWLRSDYSRIA